MKNLSIHRRQLLKNIAIALPAGMLMPSLLTACRKDEIKFSGKAIVIGAGASGMYAAYLLNNYGIDVSVLEAASVYGGRIRPLQGFSDFTIELGAEEIHGENSTWHDIVTSLNKEFVNADDESFYFVDSLLKSETQLANDNDINALYELTDNIENYFGADKTMTQYLADNNIAQRVSHIGNALLGNEFGTSNDRLGATGVASSSRKWNAGNQNFMLKNAHYLQVLEEKFASILPKIQLNTQVKTINYSGSQILLTDQNGNSYEADKIIITVPLSILQSNDITFAPALSTSKQTAINSIGMGAGMKIVLKFSTTFWATNLGSVYGSGYVPEFWATGLGRSADNNTLTAFVMGEKAEYLSSLDAGAIDIVVAELDQMYGAGVASGSLIESHIMDWSQEPFIKGAYSYPKVGTGNSRETLAQSIDDKLFFAGEATHTEGHEGTVHGAIETAQTAVEELVSKK
jgi:monoamine oxidase